MRTMMRNLMIVAVAGALAACSQQGENDVNSALEIGDTTEETVETAEEMIETDRAAELETWQATVRGLNDSAVTGEVALRDVSGQGTFVKIAIDGAAPNAVMPWHVHRGVCESGGEPVGDASGYPPLTANSEGQAEAQNEIALDLKPDMDYHVNIHQSAEEMSTIIACGEVKKTQ